MSTEENVLDETIIKFKSFPRRHIVDLTFGWALSLRDKYSVWPDGAPKPTDATLISEQTNGLFLYTIRYLMYHEVGHLANHRNMIDLATRLKQKMYEPTDENKHLNIALEQEADKYAFDSLFISEDDDNIKHMKVLSMVIAHLYGFFLLNGSDTRSTIYPDMDVRLHNIIMSTDLPDKPYHTSIWTTVTTGLQMYMHVMKIPYIPNDNRVFADFEELSSYLFGVIDNEKAKWREREIKKNKNLL